MMTPDEIRRGIELALRNGTGGATATDILIGLMNKELTLLEFGAGFLVVCTENYPSGRALKICVAHGLIDKEQPDILSFVERLARDLGCNRILIEGRRGWARQLSQFGYAEQYVVVTKEVT